METYSTDWLQLKGQRCSCEADFGSCWPPLTEWQSTVLGQLAQTPGVSQVQALAGMGRDAVSLLAPMVVESCWRAMLVLPAALVPHYENAYARLRQHYRVPSVVFPTSRSHVLSGTPVLHVVTSGQLSVLGGGDVIDTIDPQLIVCEQQSGRSARGFRLTQFVRRKSPRALVWLRPPYGEEHS